jgi:hypothetical protein
MTALSLSSHRFTLHHHNPLAHSLTRCLLHFDELLVIKFASIVLHHHTAPSVTVTALYRLHDPSTNDSFLMHVLTANALEETYKATVSNHASAVDLTHTPMRRSGMICEVRITMPLIDIS